MKSYLAHVHLKWTGVREKDRCPLTADRRLDDPSVQLNHEMHEP